MVAGFERLLVELEGLKTEDIFTSEEQDRIRSLATQEEALSSEESLELIKALYVTGTLTRQRVAGVYGEPEFDDPRERAEEQVYILDSEKVKVLARSLVDSLNPEEGEKVVLFVYLENLQIAAEVARVLMEEGIDFDLDGLDTLEFARVLANKKTNIEAYTGEKTKLYAKEPKNLHIATRTYPTEVTDLLGTDTGQTNSAVFGRLKQAATSYLKPGVSELITLFPTEQEAGLDSMTHEEYVGLFFEACDQPWEAIAEAQEVLKGMLDEADKIHITNSDGTDITLNVAGQGFMPTTTEANFPGSEIFSSPLKTGVKGTIVAKGKFAYAGNAPIEDITLKFENGQIVYAHARVNDKELQEIMKHFSDIDFLGEIAFGTNPHIRQHLVNPHLTEKVNGSFHVALGACHTFTTDFQGRPVKVNNDNTSSAHWDITTMLRGKDGVVEIDGKVIQKDGVWLDPKLAVLNEGWASLPSDQQPDWWQSKFPNGYEH